MIAYLIASFLSHISTYLPCVFAIPILILYGIQNHLSVSIVIAAITSVMMLMAGSKLRYFLTFGAAGATAGGIGLFAYATFKVANERDKDE